MIKRFIYKQDVWPHHKLPSDADTPPLTTTKTVHITVATNEFVCIITQRHSQDGILHETLLLREETRKL